MRSTSCSHLTSRLPDGRSASSARSRVSRVLVCKARQMLLKAKMASPSSFVGWMGEEDVARVSVQVATKVANSRVWSIK